MYVDRKARYGQAISVLSKEIGLSYTLKNAHPSAELIYLDMSYENI